jgi:hypothetical protein
VGVHPPPSPARANFTLMTECTPESSDCNSVYSVARPAAILLQKNGEGGWEKEENVKTYSCVPTDISVYLKVLTRRPPVFPSPGKACM